MGRINFSPDIVAIKKMREYTGSGIEECKRVLHKENILRYLYDRKNEPLSNEQLIWVLEDIIGMLP